MLSELSHLQEAMDQLEKHTSDPYSLPPASEQVLSSESLNQHRRCVIVSHVFFSISPCLHFWFSLLIEFKRWAKEFQRI